MARSVGVLHPELIRVSEVPSLPLPEDIELKQAAIATGLLGLGMVGLTLGYGVKAGQPTELKVGAGGAATALQTSRLLMAQML